MRSKRSMIATPHYLASSAGIRVLNRGGSAVDAAIAANTVLCVVYPHMGGLGGDGFWLITNPKGKGVKAINASGQAAQLATRDYYKVRGHKEKIPFRGPLAALTVPGVVDGWRLAYEEYGKLDWKDLFTDAIYYARNGMAVATSLSDWLQKDLSELSSYPSTSDIFLPNGRVPLEGEPLIQTDLAKSLDEIAKNGPREGFYESSITKKICDDLGPEGSPLQPEDFSKYHADWVNPISITYHGYTIYELPPNTQGFSALQILNILERLDIVSMGEGTVDYYHNMAEAVKVAFADRDAWLTDPKFVDIPLDIFLSKDYAAQRRQLICSDSALEMKKVEPGIPFNTQASRRSPGGGTCYFCVADEDKLVVSVIQSIYFDFGSAVVAKDTGILLQNRGSFFSLDEKHVNTLEPGK